MLKLTSFVFSLLLFAVFSFAQTESGLTDEQRAYLEEFGNSTPNLLYSDDKIFSDDPSTWGSITSAPSFFGRPTMGVIGDYLYIHTSQNATSLALALYLPTNTWSTSTACSFPSFNNAYTVAHGQLYKLSSSGFERFNPDGTGTGTWTTLTNGPSTITPAQNSMAWDGGDYIYLYSSGTSLPYPSYLQRYHIVNGTWESRASSLFPRRYAGMATIGNYIYLVGGLLSDGTSPRICQRYNTTTNTWEQIADAPEDLNFTKWSVTTDGQYLFLVGSGGGYSTYPLSDKCYYYDPATNQWYLESTLPAQRGLPNGIFVPGFTRLFFGGGNDGTSGTSFVADCWEGTGGIYIPVELTSFTAVVVGNSVQLNWSTASETNNMGFEIERKVFSPQFPVSNSEWNIVGYVDGKGTTTEIHNYSFTDQNVVAGTYAYRLKQIDFDGTLNYSNAVEVDLNGLSTFSLEQNYPNPFNPSTKISWQLPIASHQVLKVFDVLGIEVTTLVDEYKPAGIYEIDFDAGSLSSGVYIYKLQAGDFVSVKKMLLTK
jgi:hypothetical protein